MYWKEIVASLYPWDLLDEGLDAILDVLERDALVNSTYLVALMHDEKRPLTDFYYPHNPRRKVYWTEIREHTGHQTRMPIKKAVSSRACPVIPNSKTVTGSMNWLPVHALGNDGWGRAFAYLGG